MSFLGMADPFMGGGARVALCIPVSHAQIREILRTFVPDWRGSAPLGCAGSLGC